LQKFVVVTLVAGSLVLINAQIRPARAGGDDVAARLAAGTIIGAVVAGPRYFAPPRIYVDRNVS
jgi:hypothetical protein